MDIKNKTIDELRSMGFKDMVSFEMKHDPINGDSRPVLPPEEKQRLQRLSEEMQQDLNDPDFHLDTLGDQGIDEEQSLDNPRTETDRQLFRRIKKQKYIDDQRIQLVYKALEKGIPLQDDHLYREMLAMYPYYQNILAEKQAQIAKIKRMKELHAKTGKRTQYKFEQQIKGKANLNFIDVETVDQEQEPAQEKDFAYYDQLLTQYEQDLKEIQTMSETIEDDVIDSKDAEQDVNEHMQEEIRTEKMLGARYMAKIDDADAGSALEDVNRRNHPDLMMKQFFQEYQDKVENENMSAASDSFIN